MTAQNFAAVMAAELVYEGGKVDNPKDPAGRTNQGVTQRVYDGWRVAHGLPKRDVYAMIAEERDAIYRLQFSPIVAARLQDRRYGSRGLA